MQYLIGEILRQYIKDNELKIKHLSVDADVDRSSISNIMAGKRTVTEKLLYRIIKQTEIFKKPLKKYIKETIDTLDTATLIDVYNTIYNNKKGDINK